MADLQRVENQSELKCDAEKFFDVWARKSQLVSKMCPDKYPKIELNEGDCWDKVGSVQTWHYVINDIGERAFVKIRIEEFDEANRFVRYSYQDGLIVKNYYKTLKSMIQATPKGEGCVVKWSIEYEKMNEDAPEPNDIGERASVKIGVEELDDVNKFVRYTYHDGLIMKSYYKSLKSKIQAIPKAEGCIVKWSFEYEKKNEDAPKPNMYIDYLLTVARDIGVYLCDA